MSGAVERAKAVISDEFAPHGPKGLLRDLVAEVERLGQSLSEVERERDEARNANELDRSVVATGLAGIRKALKGHEWLRLGRGSYEYDDQRWMDEFSAAFDEIVEAMKPLEIVARNVADCPDTQTGANTARALLNRAEAAEQDRDRLTAERDTMERGWQESIVTKGELSRQVNRLTSGISICKEAIESLEWVPLHDNPAAVCPWCGGHKIAGNGFKAGHRPDCLRRQALAKIGGEGVSE